MPEALSQGSLSIPGMSYSNDGYDAIRFQTIGAVAGKVQHDFGNLLSVIRLALKDGGRDKELLEAAHQSADKMKKLLDEMTRISNLVQVNVGEVDLDSAVETALRGVEGHFGGLKLVFRQAPGPVRVLADANALSKELLSVVSAALGVDKECQTLTVSVRSGESFGTLELDFSSPVFEGVAVFEQPSVAFAPSLKMPGVALEVWRASFVVGTMGGKLAVTPTTLKISLRYLAPQPTAIARG